jgi:peroxiredoxin
MKKVISRLLLSAIIIILLLLTAGIVTRASRAREQMDRLDTLPDFTIPSIDGSIFRSCEISTGPLLVTYFHPECEHCQYEISSLFESNIPEGNVKVVLISYAGRFQIETFMKQFDIKNEAPLWVLCDTAFVFREIFGTEIIPSNFIYDKDLRLVRALKGEVKSETLIKYLGSGD